MQVKTICMRFEGVTISAGQLRAARGLLGWSQTDLAEAAKIGRATIADFESGKREPYVRTIDELRAALESAGVEFTNGDQPGVRMKAGYKPPPAAKPEFTPFGVEEGIQSQVGPQRRPRPRDNE